MMLIIKLLFWKKKSTIIFEENLKQNVNNYILVFSRSRKTKTSLAATSIYLIPSVQKWKKKIDFLYQRNHYVAKLPIRFLLSMFQSTGFNLLWGLQDLKLYFSLHRNCDRAKLPKSVIRIHIFRYSNSFFSKTNGLFHPVAPQLSVYFSP